MEVFPDLCTHGNTIFEHSEHNTRLEVKVCSDETVNGKGDCALEVNVWNWGWIKHKLVVDNKPKYGWVYG